MYRPAIGCVSDFKTRNRRWKERLTWSLFPNEPLGSSPEAGSWPPSCPPGPASAETPAAFGRCCASCCSSATSPPWDSFAGGIDETGVGVGSMGVIGVASLGRLISLFFSSVLKKTLIVVLRDLCGLQSSADRGECSQTGQLVGSFEWQSSQMACSQHGRRKALTASLLQMAHRSLAGISS